MQDLTAETLFVKFKAQLDSMDQLVNDFQGTHDKMEKISSSFYDKIVDNSKKAKKEILKDNEEMVKGAEKASSSVKNKMSSAFGEVAGALGLSKLAGLFTAVGGVMSMLAFVDQTMKVVNSTTVAKQMLTGAGGGLPGVGQAAQFGDFQNAMRTYMKVGTVGALSMPLGTQEEAAKVGGTLLSTHGIGGANIFGTGAPGGAPQGLALQAMLMGRGTGLGSEAVVGMFSQMIGKLDIPANKVIKSFDYIYQRGKDVGDVNGEYMKTVLNVTQQMKSYGVSLDTVADLTHDFWHDIHDGKVSMEELTQSFKIGKTATEGQAAFMAMNILAKSSNKDVSRMFAGIKDPISGAERFREVMTGTYLDINQPLTEAQSNDPQAVAARQKASSNLQLATLMESYKGVKAFVDKSMPGGDEGAKRWKMQQMLNALPGISLPTNPLEANKYMNLLEKGATTGAGLTDKEQNDLLASGLKVAETEEDILKRIEEVLGNILRGFGALLLGVAQWMPGISPETKKIMRDEAAHALGMKGIDEVNASQPSGARLAKAGISGMVARALEGHTLEGPGIDYPGRGKENSRAMANAIIEAEKGKAGEMMKKELNKLHIVVDAKVGVSHDGHLIVTKVELDKILDQRDQLNGNTPVPSSSAPVTHG